MTKKRTKTKGADGGPDYLRTLTKATQRRFLVAYAKSGNVKLACEASGLTRTWFYRNKQACPEFAKAVELAKEDATDALEAVARELATIGAVRKKFTASGDPIMDPETGAQYVEHEVSTSLLMFLLRAMRPDVYRERHEVQHTGPGGGPVQVLAATHSQIMASPEIYAQAVELAAKIEAQGKGTIPSVETE